MRRRAPMKRSSAPKRRSAMKRGKPLARGNPLERGDCELKRTGRLKPRSAKMEAKYVVRRELVERILEERPMCEACPVFAAHDGRNIYRKRKSVDLHEVLPRGRGGNILDPRQIIAVCRTCHRRITEHTRLAERLGLVLPAWVTSEAFTESARLRSAWVEGQPFEPSWSRAF